MMSVFVALSKRGMALNQLVNPQAYGLVDQRL